MVRAGPPAAPTRTTMSPDPKTPPAPEPPHKWVITGTVLLGTIMAVLDSSVVNVALPPMRGSFGATVEEITWVVTGYILATVIIMPLIALLSARFGRRNFYLANILLFTIASMACGLSRSLPEMVLFRVVQGAGGGVLMTVSQAILRETFPPAEQGLAMGIYGMGVVLAPAFGPTLGGWLTDQYSWPWVFFINVPIGAINLALAARYIHDPPYLERAKRSLDWVGLAAMVAGLGALQLLLEKGQSRDWFQSGFINTLAVIAVVGLAVFVWRELHTTSPAVNLRLMRNVSFASATAIGGVLGMGLYGTLFLLPLFLQNLLGFSAMVSGIALMPRSLAMAVCMPVAGRLYNRLGPRLMVGAGLAVSAYSFVDLGRLTTQVGVADLVVPQLWQGVGFSLIFVALSTAALSEIRRADMTAAAGLYNVVRQVFGSVGVAVSATMLTSSTVRYHALLSEHVTRFDPQATGWLAGVARSLGQREGLSAGPAMQRALELLNLRVLRQAAVLAYNHAFVLVAGLFVLSVPLVLLLKAKSHGAAGANEVAFE